MVRRSRHHGLVGQSLAQRGLCELDAGKGGRAILSAMENLAQWLQPEAVRHDARRAPHRTSDPAAGRRPERGDGRVRGITYNKGQAFIRMLENYLGEGAFRDGIRRYMAAHAYGNTTTADLWQALEAAAGKPVAAIAASFTEQDGVPLVVAETSCNGDDQRLALRQERFAIVP